MILCSRRSLVKKKKLLKEQNKNHSGGLILRRNSSYRCKVSLMKKSVVRQSNTFSDEFVSFFILFSKVTYCLFSFYTIFSFAITVPTFYVLFFRFYIIYFFYHHPLLLLILRLTQLGSRRKKNRYSLD